MRFTEYLSSAGGGGAPDGVHPDLGLVCFEDGTCVPGSGKEIGRRQYPDQRSSPQHPNPIYGDGTGGPIVFRGAERVSPQPVDVANNPQNGIDFALLLELLKRRGR